MREYRYNPSLILNDITADLYEEVGSISMTLIRSKIRRAQERL